MKIMSYEAVVYGMNKIRDETRTFSQPGTAIEWANYVWENDDAFQVFQVEVYCIEDGAYGGEPMGQLIWQAPRALI